VPLYINRLCERNVFYEARQSMQVKALTGLLRHCVPRNDEWNCYSANFTLYTGFESPKTRE
ncbi:MAG: hypothetical protein LBH05_06430, partial [Deferribacteraceae bacterium]|nr:hypothetical protein [Deferribacteraceae bacterium]